MSGVCRWLYLVQVQLHPVSGLQAVCRRHLMDHVPCRLDHGLHGVQDVLRDRGHTVRPTPSPLKKAPPPRRSADLQAVSGEVALVM